MSKKKNKKMFISFIINIILSVLTVNTIIMCITGFQFMKGYEPYPELFEVPIYSYYTVQASVFMGIVSFIFANKEYQVLKGRKKDIPLIYYILKMVATVAVSLTFFVVFFIFGFMARGGHLGLIRNSYLFFHLIIPIISILNFVIFEKTDIIKFKHVFYCLLPTFLYEIYYSTNLLLNMKDGITMKNDWYAFAQKGLLNTLLVVPLMLGITFCLSLAIWRLNKKLCYNYNRM